MKRKGRKYYKRKIKRILIPYLILIYVIPSYEIILGQEMIISGSLFLGNIMVVVGVIIIGYLFFDLLYTIYKILSL